MDMNEPFEFPLNRYLTAAERERVKQHLIISEVDAGTVLFDATECRGVLVVIRGIVRVYNLSESGREITLYRLFENDICTLSVSCLLGSMPLQAMVKADTDCTIASLSNDVFSDLHRNNSQIQHFLLTNMSARISDVMWVVEQVAFASMDRRIGEFLLSQPSLVVYVTHDKIAQELGTAREVVSRMLKYFEKNGYIELSRGKLKIIDPEGLQRSFSIQ